MLRRLFEPLGYDVRAERHPLDPHFPEWGEGPYFAVTLAARCRLGDLLSHLYVLVPVLDNDKHYWVGDDEVDKLLRHGEGWLPRHPDRDLIARRYLRHQHGLTRAALSRLTEEDDPDPDATTAESAASEERLEERVSLNRQRLEAVAATLKECGARRVLDLGCGEGRLIQVLLSDPAFEEVVGVDVAIRPLEVAARRLHLDRLPEAKRKRVRLLQGSLTYRDRRLEGYDAAAVVEVVEHLDPPRLAAFERVLFGFARPGAVVLTTPNVEYNAKFEGLAPGSFRHRDHRFEWTRAEFRAWAEGAAGRFGYAARYRPVGPEDEALGPPTQMAVFTRDAGGGA
jgi:3' terminal RNA ribose 2'-O-methyltransferase Hen1